MLGHIVKADIYIEGNISTKMFKLKSYFLIKKMRENKERETKVILGGRIYSY